LPVAPVVNQIDAGIYILVTNSGIGWNAGVPLGGISTNEVINLTGQQFLSDDGRILSRSQEFEL
jgi:hypothetical protein